MKISRQLQVTAAALLLGFATGSSAAPIAAGWTSVGNTGNLGADGVVTLPPNGDTQYSYVSTDGGVNGVALPGVGVGSSGGSGTDGSVATSPQFAASAGDNLSFYFNYVTSDGADYADYAWARLLDSSSNQVALLFTARTTTGGDTVPGYSMPAPTASLTPSSTPIIAGGPSWSPLGFDSGSCFDVGCGYTGWVEANYTIADAGNYYLEFGVTNWDDTYYDSGMAFAGETIAGVPISTVPLPGTLILLCSGLAGLLGVSRRNKTA